MIFAVIGDTQRTLWIERLFLFREQNDEARAKLAQALDKESAQFIVHLGDMVSDGTSGKEWKVFDQLFPNQKSIYPVLGNHEYWKGEEGLKKIFTRFPNLQESHWYSKTFEGVGMIWLDTNKKNLASSDWESQRDWFKKTLNDFDKNLSIRAVLVYGHHPPFSNSKTTGDCKWVEETFLSDFFGSSKGLAWFSGHSHTYERFNIKGKTFLVAGGGGGPRVKLKKGLGAHADLFVGPSPRPFHYLVIKSNSSGIEMTVKGFHKADKNISVMEEVTLLFAK